MLLSFGVCIFSMLVISQINHLLSIYTCLQSLVDELLGVHKAPLSLSPPQTKRLSFNRLSSVPVLELCATPNDSPHRPVHSARTDTSAADANTAPKTPVPGVLPL